MRTSPTLLFTLLVIATSRSQAQTPQPPTSTPTRPPTRPTIAGFAAFTADGSAIVYQMNEGGRNDAELHVMKLDGLKDRVVPGAAGASPNGLSVSRDGRLISYTSFVMKAGGPPAISLSVAKTDGSGGEVIAHNGGLEAVWSPDSKRILYTTVNGPMQEPGAFGVSVINADGTGAIELSKGLSSPQSTGWSPDGRMIAFAAPTDQGTAIFVANADGTSRRQLVAGVPFQNSATWSPDGRLIAFYGGDGAPPRFSSGHHLYVVRPDGSQLRQIVADTKGASSASFSPDGKSIVFANRSDGKASDIFVVDMASLQVRTLVAWPGTDELPRWSPDGKQIVFQSSEDPRGVAPRVFIMNADGSNVRQVAPLPGTRP